MNINFEVGPGYNGFWQDFSIADVFGVEAIINTYNRAFDEWKNDYKYLTDLVMVLNHKMWDFYGLDEQYCELYETFWRKADQYACNNLKDNELKYFLKMTD